MDDSSTMLLIVLKALEDNGVSDYQVVRACGLSNSLLSDWRHGRRKSPGFDKVFKVLKYLKVDMNTINLADGTFSYIGETTHDIALDKQEELSDDERRLLSKYRNLDLDGKDSVKGFIVAQERRSAAVRGNAHQENHLAI